MKKWGLVFSMVIFSFVLFQNFTFSEKLVEHSGELESFVEDYSNHSSVKYFLKTKTHGRIELSFNGKNPHLLSGSKIRVRGKQKTVSVLELNSSDSNSIVQLAAAPTISTLGPQNLAVILVNFSDNPVTPYTKEQVTDLIFNKLNSFMYENSYGQTTLVGNVFGYYTIPTITNCNSTELATYAKQSVTNSGVDIAPYQRFIYIFPTLSGCGWSGLGTMGGVPTESWINGMPAYRLVSTTAHEMGHNFGLYHSHAMDCGVTTISSNCNIAEYGDIADTMGNTTNSHYNAAQKISLGWLASGIQPEVTTVTSSGTFFIGGYEMADGTSKALKVLKNVDPITGIKSWYYVEYRRPNGFDLELSTFYSMSNLVNGLLIHSGQDGDPNSFMLLDATPNSDIYYDIGDASLTLGNTFTDSSTGISIATSSLSNTEAQVTVSYGQAICSHQSPMISITPSTQSTSAGSSANYTVTIANKDNSQCNSSQFNLSAVLPGSGWSATFNNSSLLIAPGQQLSTNMTVISPLGAALGGYNLTINASANGINSSSFVTYFVIAGLEINVSTDKSAYSSNQTARISTIIKNGGSPVNGATISLIITKPNGAKVSLSGTSNSSGVAVFSYKLTRKDPAGVYQIKANASVNGVSGTGTASFSKF